MDSLQVLNTNNKAAAWAQRIAECRSSGIPVKTWCKEHGLCEQTYYKWQKRLFEMAQEQQAPQFAEITPARSGRAGATAVTVRIGKAEAEIHNGADGAVVETVLRFLARC